MYERPTHGDAEVGPMEEGVAGVVDARTKAVQTSTRSAKTHSSNNMKYVKHVMTVRLSV